MSQKSYIESLAKRYCIENSKLFKTPMEVNLKLQQCDVNENVKYRNLIVALLCVKLKDEKFQVNIKCCNIKVRRRVGILYFSIGNNGLLCYLWCSSVCSIMAK